MDKDEGPSCAKRRKSNHLLDPDFDDSDTDDEVFMEFGGESDLYDPLQLPLEDESKVDNIPSLGARSSPPRSSQTSPIPSAEVTSPKPAPDQSCEDNHWDTINKLWTKECKLRKDITFTKKNEFFGDVQGNAPIDYFNFFCTDEFLKKICDDANAYARETVSDPKVQVTQIMVRWRELKVDELRVFIGLLFHMGTIRMNWLQSYWRRCRLFRLPIFPNQMSRNRFVIILKWLFAKPKKYAESRAKTNTETSEAPRKLFEVSDVVQHFNDKMACNYYPARELTLDECMTLYDGQMTYRLDMGNLYGTKLYSLSEPDGTVLKLIIHVRKYDYASCETKGKNVERIVMELMETYLNNGHSLHLDDTYNSYRLSRIFLRNNTHTTGFLNKILIEHPPEFSKACSMKMGENMSRFRDDVHVGVWKNKENRVIPYVTSLYENVMAPIMAKNNRNIIIKPIAIARHEEIMLKVNRRAQTLSFYPLEDKKLRWELKMAIHVFQLMLLNSFKLYNKFSGKRPMNLHDYRLEVIKCLLPEKIIVPKKNTDQPTAPKTSGAQSSRGQAPSAINHAKIQQKVCEPEAAQAPEADPVLSAASQQPLVIHRPSAAQVPMGAQIHIPDCAYTPSDRVQLSSITQLQDPGCAQQLTVAAKKPAARTKIQKKSLPRAKSSFAQTSAAVQPYSSSDEDVPLSAVHKIKLNAERQSNNKVKRRMCRYCSRARNKRKDCRFYCATCPDKPSLCYDCFKDYHIQLSASAEI